MSVYPAPVNFDPATHSILSRHWFGTKRSIQTIIDRKLEPEVLEATGGDGFWPAPLHEVRRVTKPRFGRLSVIPANWIDRDGRPIGHEIEAPSNA